MTAQTAYRFGLGLAVLTTLATLWVLGAVGIVGAEGDRADLLYVGALGVGLVGALTARFRAAGMVWAMSTTAALLLLAGVVALLAGRVPSYNSAAEVLGLSVGFASLFAVSGWLFRRSASGRS